MYLRNNKDPQFKIGVLSSQWLLKHSVCIRVAKSEHWTPSSPLPWDLAFHLNSFSNYYSSLQSISAIYHTLLAHLHKKNGPACTTHQNGRRTDSEECSKGRAIPKIQRESEARMLVRFSPPERGKMRASVLKNDLFILNCFKFRFSVWSADNFNNASLNLLEKEDRGNHLSLFQ